MQADTSDEYVAEALEVHGWRMGTPGLTNPHHHQPQEDIFEWHFAIRGPKGTDFEVGRCMLVLRARATPDD